jgi:peptidoglycan/LPS O-acetylase OafA/YrhL
MSRNLDVLRAVAVLSVFLSHLTEGPAIGLGSVGVMLFFVHTSLVLMLSLERDGRVGAFYLRRAFRIYPLSIVTVVSVILLQVPPEVNAAFAEPAPARLLRNLTLTQNFGHGGVDQSVLGPLWSLPWEVQMYIALPLVFYFCRSARAVWTLIGACTVLRITGLETGTRFLTILQFAPCFLAGVLAYRTRPRPSFASRWWLPAVLSLVALWGFILNKANQSGNYVLMNLVWYGISLSVGLVIPLFQEIPTGIVSRSAAVIAKYSYGIYLSHVPVIWFAFVVLKGLPGLIQWLVLIVAATALPVVLYHTIESPLIGAGKRLTQPTAARSRRAVAAT